MDGVDAKIEIFKPFGQAFELMKKILFQPFDLKRWLVIGFAAWLANLGGGGGGNFRYPDNGREYIRKLGEKISEIPGPILVTGICILVCLVLLLIVLIAWLRARGRFVFVDSIVRNRAAIVQPWKEYRVEGNSFCLFSLVVALVLFLVLGIAGLGLILPFIHRGAQAEHGIGFWIGLSLFVFIAVCVALVWGLLSQLMVPIMYRRRCRARLAFVEVMDLVASHPGTIFLYVLFVLVLAIAVLVISCVVLCATCCVAAIPYVGSVILLPVSVTLGAFLLLFLRQFGSDYDVWAASMPSEFLPVLMSTPASASRIARQPM